MKQESKMMSSAKCIAYGMLVGSALGTALTVMAKSKKQPKTLREKAAAAMDTVGTVMHNMADFTR